MRFSYTVIFRRKRAITKWLMREKKNRKKLECVLFIEMSVSDVEVNEKEKKFSKIIAKINNIFMFH